MQKVLTKPIKPTEIMKMKRMIRIMMKMDKMREIMTMIYPKKNHSKSTIIL